jgi:hypothetical protein
VAKLGKTSANILEIRGELILQDNALIPPCDGPTTASSKCLKRKTKFDRWERYELFIERRE